MTSCQVWLDTFVATLLGDRAQALERPLAQFAMRTPHGRPKRAHQARGFGMSSNPPRSRYHRVRETAFVQGEPQATSAIMSLRRDGCGGRPVREQQMSGS